MHDSKYSSSASFPIIGKGRTEKTGSVLRGVIGGTIAVSLFTTTLIGGLIFIRPEDDFTTDQVIFAALVICPLLNAIGVYLVLRAQVLNPIKDLTRSIEQLPMQGTDNLSPSERKDEIGELERSVTNIVKKIKKNQEHLSRVNFELQQDLLKNIDLKADKQQ